MELYIVRHGTTSWNEQKKLQGSADIQLNEEGRKVAALTGEALKNVSFDKIYTSPLQRASQTARLICKERSIPIVEDYRLRELDFGAYEGENAVKLQHDQSKAFRFFFSEPEKYRSLGGGEELENLCARAREFLVQEIEPRKSKFKRVMIVGHGALNKALLCHIQNHGIRDFWSGGLQSNCGVMIVRYDENGYTLLEADKVFYQ